MNEAEIRQRLSRGEDSATQFKREPIDVAKLAALGWTPRYDLDAMYDRLRDALAASVP